MDTEKLKRIQELANHLCEYKLAQNMEDALGQAERIVENETNLIVKRMDDGRYVDPAKHKYNQMMQSEQSNGNGMMTHTQMTNMTDSHADQYMDQNEVKRLNRKIAEMENMVEAVVKKMNEMISEINRLQDHNKVFGQTTLKAESPGHAHSSHAKKKQVGVVMPDGSISYPSSSEEAHPRTGSYTSSDVSVDKMFNFSGRR